MTDDMLDHEWVAPPDLLLDNTDWSPGACAHRATPTSDMCGVHLLAWRHLPRGLSVAVESAKTRVPSNQ